MTSLPPIRVMLVVPENNTTMHHELLAWLPQGSSCEVVRVPRGKGLLTQETLPSYKDSTITVCQEAADAKFDIVAYGCTAAGFILGPQGDREMAERIASVTGKPVVTTAASMVQALQAINAKKISLLTPYQDHVNDQLKLFLLAGDIQVQHFDSFYAPDVIALGNITAKQVHDRATSLLARDVDALFIACSQLPTLEILDKLSQTFKKPVLSSIQVTATALINHSSLKAPL
jgi:maleate cis-trans isomerase